MTDKELERRLELAVSHSAPDDLEEVLSRCVTRKGNVTEMKKNKTPAVRWLAAACLALILVGGGSGVIYQQTCAVASVVSLDINPSIELKINRNEKVLSCTALNEEAAAVLADMGGGADLEGTKLDVAVNAIVGALVRCGYLDDLSSAILISVEDKNSARAAKLQQELTGVVDAVLQEQAPNTAVLTQTLAQDTQLDQQAKENSISTGKAAIVNQALSINSALKFDELAALSVEELKELIEAGVPGMPIGKDAAIEAAEQYAGIQSADSVTGKADPELDEYPACYEVELRHPDLGKFEYRIDAYTGAVLSGRADISSVSPGTAPTGSGNTAAAPSAGTSAQTKPSGSSYIGEDAAKAAALSHAGVAETDTKYCNVWLEYDDGRPECYQVEFVVNGTEYEYEIGLYDSSVLKYEREVRSSFSGTSDAEKRETQEKNDGKAAQSTAAIEASEAKSIALDHAGVTESQVTKLKAELDNEKGRLEYEVEFKYGKMEYEYKIDATTGEILAYETDRDD